MLLNGAFNFIVCLQKKRIKRETQLKWMNPEIMALLTSRNSLFKKAKRQNNPVDLKMC